MAGKRKVPRAQLDFEQRVYPTVEDLERALPDILERRRDDLIESTQSGRIFVVMVCGAFAADGSFPWAAGPKDLDEVRPLLPQLRGTLDRIYAEIQSQHFHPVLLLGSDTGLVMAVFDLGSTN